VVLPVYEAATVQVPIAALDVMGSEIDHSPELFKVTVPWDATVPFGSVTVYDTEPVGVPELLVTSTVIVSVSPAYTGSGEVVTEVVVAAGVLTWTVMVAWLPE
jgi:hypothetical protein